MSQSDFGVIDRASTDGNELATLLEGFRDALESNHKGSSRPSYVTAGMMWIDDSSDPIWQLKFYTGSGDVVLMSLHKTDLKITVPIAGGGTGANDADTALTNLGALKNVLTTRGDIIVRGNAAAQRLGFSAADQAPVFDGTDTVAKGILKQGLHTVNLPAAAWRPQITNGCDLLFSRECPSFKVMVDYLAFSASAQQYAQTSFRLPKSVNPSATIAGTIEWEEDTGATLHDVRWTVEMQCQGDGDTIDSVWGTVVPAVDTGSAGTRRFASFTAVTPGGTPQQLDKLLIRVSRDPLDAADTLDTKAHLIEVNLLLTLNKGDDT